MYALALKGKTSSDLLTVVSSSFTTQGNRRDKPTIEFDPEIEKTLKKNRSRVKAQRSLQFDQEEANCEEGASEKSFEEELVEENTKEEIQDNMADNANNQRRTLPDYTNPITTSCGSNIVWPNVDANNFELKPALWFGQTLAYVHSFLIANRKFNYSPSFNRCLTNLLQTRALEIRLTD
ncbi:hypothetical protein PIB30_057908 [Stylosanthes scabra]|uniref:Uncharacterized protein n=1 Tax=Stylosanthes scabra TaxID=79078 RepID=A0ABU6ZIH2_9FABA|nr:hypothetical protein [Stylosanthes scabra]